MSTAPHTKGIAMRNESRTLTTTEAARVAGYARSLRAHAANGHIVTVSFTKRDGTPRIITGPVLELRGTGSHAVITIDTEQGPRSANVYNVHSVKGGK